MLRRLLVWLRETRAVHLESLSDAQVEENLVSHDRRVEVYPANRPRKA